MKIKLSNCGLIGIAVFAILAWGIWMDGYFLSCALSPDGVSYLRMAESAAHGHLFNPNGVSGHPGWFARWPLGYPWCIAAIAKLTSWDAFTSARALATVIAGGLLLLLARCARQAFPLLALSLLNLSFCGVFRLSYSEQPYILALVALCFLLSGTSEWGGLRVGGIAGLCLSAFLFRYVGVFALLWAFATTCLVTRLKRQDWKCIRYVAVACLVAGTFAGGYLLMNRMMCGSFTGGHPPGAPEPFFALAKRMVLAMLNEAQAFVFAFGWAVALFFAAGARFFRGRAGRPVKSAAPLGGTVFIVFGLVCNVTVIMLRFLMPFDSLGFRLLCPGTTLLVLGTLLAIQARLGSDWSQAINAVPLYRILAFLLVAALPAANFLSMERELRRVMHLPMESWYGSYREVKAEVMEKYAEVPSGTRFTFPSKFNGVYYWIDFLRPDILADVPDSPDKGF